MEVGVQRHALAALPPGKTWHSLYRSKEFWNWNMVYILVILVVYIYVNRNFAMYQQHTIKMECYSV